MPRDYKNTTSRRRGGGGSRGGGSRSGGRASATRRRSGSGSRKPIPGWLILLFGVTFGLFATLLAWLTAGDEVADQPPLARVEPQQAVSAPPTPRPARPAVTPATTPRPTPTTTTLPKPPPPPAKPAEPRREVAAIPDPPKPEPEPEPEPELPPRPRFDFYTMLPELETVVPPQELSSEVRDGVQLVKSPGVYMLQAGSFRTHAQADQLKARIALLGLTAEIHQAVNVGNESWHRVRIGPYSDLDRLNSDRTRLKQDGFDTMLLKVTQPDQANGG